jgi:PAS domain S-box-containing protein
MNLDQSQSENQPQQKQVESTLRQSEQRFRLAVDNSPDVFVIYDANLRLQFVNAEGLRRSGIAGEDLIGRTDVEIFPPEITNNYLPLLHRALETRSPQTAEIEFNLPSVGQYNLVVSYLPLLDDQGEVYQILGITHDISDRKQIEQRFQHDHDELERQIEERTAALLNANALLKEEIYERTRTEVSLKLQTKRERLVAEIAQHIRQSLNLDEILQTTVEEVQRFLQVDRVLIYRLWADGTGSAITEAVLSDYPAVLGQSFPAEVFPPEIHKAYAMGKIRAIPNIEQFDVSPCLVEFVSQFGVKAKLVVPILQGKNLWGLLIAHHCASTRRWQQWEIELLQQLATQAGIAIQQSELYQQARQDLLERQRIEGALRQSEERYRAIVEDQTELIARFQADGQLTFVNEAFCRYFGLRKETLMGQSWLPLVWAADRAQVLQSLQSLNAETPMVTLENRVLVGEDVRWMQWISRVIVDDRNRPIEWQAVGRDITVAKQLEAERQQAERKILEQAALLDITTDAIIVQNLQNQILFWNKGAERLYGWLATEAIGQPVQRLFYQEVLPTLARVTKITLQQRHWQGELHHQTKAGQEIIVSSRWTVVCDADGEPQSILTVDTDITEKKRLEAQFLQMQRLESLGSLAKGIAHDFNNLLTPILATAQLLPLKLPTLDDQSRTLLQLIESNARRGADLAKQILSFASAGEGKPSLIQIKHLLLEVEQVVQQTFPPAIQIYTHVPEGLWTVAADAMALYQALINLCLNARNAMPEGGSLTLSAANQLIDRPYLEMKGDIQAGSYLMITVTDTGSGIPSDILSGLMDACLTTHPSAQSAGLGLLTVMTIVNNHGGFVRVQSAPEQGTQFKVYLPASIGTSLQLEADLTKLSGQGELILVVDDKTAICEITKATLEAYQYRVLMAHDGIEAIALYAEHNAEIRAVLLDLLMPPIDGHTAFLTMQRLNSQIPIIIMSGLTNQETIAKMGHPQFLPKPFSTQELLSSLSEALATKQNINYQPFA